MEKVTLTAADVGKLDATVLVQKHPELSKVYAGLVTEKAALVAKTAPLRAEYEKLRQQIAPLEEKARAVAKQFRALEQPRLAEIDNQLGALAKAMGGRALSDASKQG